MSPLLLLTLFAVIICIAYILYPPFGAKADRRQLRESRNHNGRRFTNATPTAMTLSAKEIATIAREQLRGGSLRRPERPIEGLPVDIPAFLAAKAPQMIWIGHSSILLRLDGKTVLTDPIFSMRASPFSFAGPKRTVSRLPVTIAQLPHIDAVLISHDHYDHLDYASVRQLRAKTDMFFVPLGVGAHLRSWGVKAEQITELDWWDGREYKGLQLACTPSRHFSGRTLTDRDHTLWASWVIKSPSASLFFSGDTGYGPHFKEIGEKYGPFDLTLMECGQYDIHWPNIHMMPEDTVKAHLDLKGTRLFPIHWGAFVLALHPWTDSVERVTKAARLAKVHLLSSRVGETLPVLSDPTPDPYWWTK